MSRIEGPRVTPDDPSDAMPRARYHAAAGAPARLPRRRWRAALAALVVTIFVLIVVDRVTASVVQRRLASRIQSSQHLTARPHVTIEGFSFLLQAFQGRYRHVNIASRAPISRDGVTVSSARVRLNRVAVSTGDVLHGTVRDVPVRSGNGTALIGYPALTALVHRYGGQAGSTITVTAAGTGKARLTGPLGLSLDVSGSIINGGLRITPDAAQLAALPTFISSGVAQALATPIPLGTLPFGVTLTSGQFEPAGLVLNATAHNSTFPVR